MLGIDRVALARAVASRPDLPLGPTYREGPRGLSAFQVWLGSHPGGTEAQFFESLKGPKGDPASSPFEHIQGTPASVWTVNHNLNFRPTITLLGVGGSLMWGEIIYSNQNQVLVYFDNPVAGIALCS